jgi:hypothetical protein
MLVCPASESGGGAEAEWARTAVRVSVVIQRGGTSVIGMQGGSSCGWRVANCCMTSGAMVARGEVLQAACSTADVAGFQGGMHAGGKRADRGRRVAAYYAC